LKSKAVIQHAFSPGLERINPEEVECEAEQGIFEAKIG
jgi:hypothetical protein